MGEFRGDEILAKINMSSYKRNMWEANRYLLDL